MVASSRSSSRAVLGRTLRERFIELAQSGMPELVAVVQERLTVLLDEVGNARDTQTRRDVWMTYREAKSVWQTKAVQAWRKGLEPVQPKPAVTAVDFDISSLQLVDAGAMDTKILASRMVQGLTEKLSAELDDLKVRIKVLEDIEELDSADVLRVENHVQVLVESWVAAGMPADSWPMVSDVVQRTLLSQLQKAYRQANEQLINGGILPVIELKDRVRGAVRSSPVPGLMQPGKMEEPQNGAPGNDFYRSGGESYDPHGDSHGAAQAYGAAYGPSSGPPSGPGGWQSTSGPAPAAANPAAQPSGPGPAPRRAGAFGGRLGWGAPTAPSSDMGQDWRRSGGMGESDSAPAPGRLSRAAIRQEAAAEETRMLTASTPLARAQLRAQGVAGHIQRIFVQQTADEAGAAGPGAAGRPLPSPELAQAIAYRVTAPSEGDTAYDVPTPQGVAQVAVQLRQKTTELKEKATTKSEKATIEIVALMFQAILSEERIPPGIRVWFARLQMPVLRTALEDPGFFGTADHPARLLIDRMGSCVMGFEGGDVRSAAMEKEVKRIVQVVEQYPETGKKVYQIVYAEFQKFLSRFLTEKSETQRVVSVAQQVEQKETLAIQYTIEMRNMLREMPVQEVVREFLFKVWAEVLAVCALRKGPKHADTQSLKKCATDLVWSASAKPNREDRTRVIQDLPQLLTRLRSGMTLLGMLPDQQEVHIKSISDTLADAFMSKTQAIPLEKIEAMAKRLGELEDLVSEDGLGDLPLDAQSIEMMLGIESSEIEVVANGGSKPTAAMLAWANELEIGSWFTLDHNSQVTQVQFAWRSNGNQLNLFAAASGKTFLLQTGRMAAYLQAGLLLPQEEEALTVRATRDALAKLEANPERLLN